MKQQFHVRSNTRKVQKRPCYLCGKQYRALSAFSRFCAECKSGQDILRFSEWLPDIDDGNARYVPVRPKQTLRAKLLRGVAA